MDRFKRGWKHKDLIQIILVVQFIYWVGWGFGYWAGKP